MSSEEFMSGKPQFDEASVIAAAIGVFRRHGYAAAAISDLTEATGLSRSSLYQRFHDKDGLFREALAAYTQRVLRRMNSAGRIVPDRGLPDRAKLCRHPGTIRGGTGRHPGWRSASA
jgi:AcrR family transcriptional regulator